MLLADSKIGNVSDFAGVRVGFDSGLSVPTPKMVESKFINPNFTGTDELILLRLNRMS